MPPSRARDVDEAAPDRPTSSGHGRRPRIVSGRLAGRRRPPTSRSCETVTGPVGGQPARIRAPRRPTAGHHRWMYAMAAGPRRQAASCRLEDSVRHPVTTTRTLDGRKNVTVGGRGGYWFLKPEWLGAPFVRSGGGFPSRSATPSRAAPTSISSDATRRSSALCSATTMPTGGASGAGIHEIPTRRRSSAAGAARRSAGPPTRSAGARASESSRPSSSGGRRWREKQRALLAVRGIPFHPRAAGVLVAQRRRHRRHPLPASTRITF